MSLRDLASVFSRYLIVGFFLPVFFALVFLAVTLSRHWVPERFEKLTGADVLVLGGLALAGGLVLTGLRESLVLALQGTRSAALYRLPRTVINALVGGQTRRFDDLVRVRDAPESSAGERRVAAYRLDQEFPDDRDDVLPTRLGNRFSATQDYAFERWGLDTQAVWPHVEALLNERERELLNDLDTDLVFFVNATLISLLTWFVVLSDEIVNEPISRWWLLLYPAGLIAPYLFYSLAVGAATRWGAHVRAVVDLHRLELYRSFGLRVPAPREERERLAPALNLFLLYGEPFPARYDDPDKASSRGA